MATVSSTAKLKGLASGCPARERGPARKEESTGPWEGARCPRKGEGEKRAQHHFSPGKKKKNTRNRKGCHQGPKRKEVSSRPPGKKTYRKERGLQQTHTKATSEQSTRSEVPDVSWQRQRAHRVGWSEASTPTVKHHSVHFITHQSFAFY